MLAGRVSEWVLATVQKVGDVAKGQAHILVVSPISLRSVAMLIGSTAPSCYCLDLRVENVSEKSSQAMLTLTIWL